ncbi:MAG: hypothetical protein HOJ57_28640 [Lentisphaerae bacterium]|mgnify:CR=1 FL=1|jgi:hypothetical protein|nr:hypothetical protein [Lentisphaerota bacterium]MBT5609941.1 hypothetical protein [Lentisphaerota bacterium]
MLTYMTVSFVGWLLAAMAFESGFEMLKGKRGTSISKADAAKVFWGAMLVLSFAATGGFLQTIALAPIAASQIDLNGRNPSARPLTLHEILQNFCWLIDEWEGRAAEQFRKTLPKRPPLPSQKDDPGDTNRQSRG